MKYNKYNKMSEARKKKILAQIKSNEILQREYKAGNYDSNARRFIKKNK